jgi:anthranilate synthase component 2
MRTLLIDNFDSFTYNLYQYLAELTDVVVVRNNVIPFDDITDNLFSHIVISPGPGNPTDRSYFGDVNRVIDQFHKTIPILGVCLGHQGIGAYFGASIIKAPCIMHGKVSTFKHSGEGVLRDLPEEITVMRYHSLVIDPATIPANIAVDASASDSSIMAFHHEKYPIFGVQFHPESFRTITGKQILSNFLKVEGSINV